MQSRRNRLRGRVAVGAMTTCFKLLAHRNDGSHRQAADTRLEAFGYRTRCVEKTCCAHQSCPRGPLSPAAHCAGGLPHRHACCRRRPSTPRARRLQEPAPLPSGAATPPLQKALPLSRHLATLCCARCTPGNQHCAFARASSNYLSAEPVSASHGAVRVQRMP